MRNRIKIDSVYFDDMHTNITRAARRTANLIITIRKQFICSRTDPD